MIHSVQAPSEEDISGPVRSRMVVPTDNGEHILVCLWNSRESQAVEKSGPQEAGIPGSSDAVAEADKLTEPTLAYMGCDVGDGRGKVVLHPCPPGKGNFSNVILGTCPEDWTGHTDGRNRESAALSRAGRFAA